MRTAFAVLFLLAVLSGGAVTFQDSNEVPPKPPREFRGMWVATVGNIDWPSRPGLSTAQQKAELIFLLDRAAKLKLNAIVFQVRPACDALYASRFEPWSEYLTGTMGRAPEPFYDPLEFAVAEAHRRGLELHAWFNPYRARHFSAKSPVAPAHITRTNPELVRKCGDLLWLDPGERDVQEHSLRVVMDVVKRYDVDGVQFDDYFYPDAPSRDWSFPDDVSWKKFGAAGKLARDDWRRENVNGFIERVYRSIKAEKPWVKFGVSPRGIWRPGNPPQIKGSDDYALHFADTRKWFANGWLDYFSPQLYWPIDQREQSFPVLLKWWTEQNTKGRHLWPGLGAYRVSQWSPVEIPNQLRILRSEAGAGGYIFYNASNVVHAATLAGAIEQANAERALVPASSWLGAPPTKPNATVTDAAGALTLSWSPSGTNGVRWWVVQMKLFSDWKTELLPAETTSKVLAPPLEAVAVTAIDRAGNASAARVLAPGKNPPRRLQSPKKY
jgi:uncharacterized lipoprotein YddW (UPF0748 family)